jgi:hypothetical protein
MPRSRGVEIICYLDLHGAGTWRIKDCEMFLNTGGREIPNPKYQISNKSQ